MRFFRKLALSALAAAALALAVAPLARCQTTNFTASSINAGNVPVTGTICLTPVNVYGNAIAITKSGGGYYEQGVPFCGTVTAGAIVGTFAVPDSATDSAPGHGYSVTITNTATGRVSPPFTVYGVTGSSFDLDNYVPPVTIPIPPAFTYTMASTPPIGNCSSPSLYGFGTAALYQCYEGQWVYLQGSGTYQLTAAAVNALTGLTISTTGNAGTANALANAPAICPGGYVASGIAANGNSVGCVLSGTPTYTGDLAANVLADYLFLDGSGLSLKDSSSNGNNGVFGNGSGAPTWVSGGVAFVGNQGIQLPTAINSARTIVLAMYYNPISSTPLGFPSTNINFSSVLTSQLGNQAGLNISMNTGAGYGQPGNYRGGSVTQCADLVVGYHVLGMTFGSGGSDLDHFYVDGQECTYYSQGSSAGAITGGNLYLGASNNSIWTSALEGTVYRMKVYSSELTAADHAAIVRLFNGEMSSRGVPTSIVPIRTVSVEMDCIGDSITAGATLNTASPYCLGVQPLLLNQPAYIVNNWGLDGMGLSQISNSEPNRVARRLPSPSAGAHVATVFAGTNDLTLQGNNPAGTYGLLKAEVTTLKQAGFKVFVGTMLSRAGEDAAHDGYNALIRTGIISAGADGILDFAADPNLGKDGAYATSCFSDATHPSDLCEPKLSNVVANALNYYFGHHATNPSIVTATSYTMTAADGFVDVQPTAATTVTLPDCTGQTGAVYTVNNSQATYAVTLKNGPSLGSGFPAQTINGVDYSSSGTFTVPANGSISLVDVALPLSTSGCVWQTR